MTKGLNIMISPVNAAWVCVAIAFILLCVPVYLRLKNKTYEQRRKALLTLASANLILFCLYLLWFQQIPGTLFWGWNMLPINLCNLVTIFFVVALAMDRKGLYRFCFYVGIAAGFLAILSPEGGLKNMELFSPVMIGFYFVHCMLYLLGISLATLRLYKPNYKDALLTVLHLEILTGIIYLINLLLRNTVYANANYFFLFETNGSPYLEALHSLVPIPPFTMMISVLPIALGLFLLMTWVYNLCTRKRRGS